MTKKYQIYGIGAALVDTEVVVTNSFLSTNKIDKSLMTLVDEERQFHLLDALKFHSNHVKRSCGGSACNSIVAASCFGLKAVYLAKVAADMVVGFGGVITKLTSTQAKYINVTFEGPFKPESYKY